MLLAECELSVCCIADNMDWISVTETNAEKKAQRTKFARLRYFLFLFMSIRES